MLPLGVSLQRNAISERVSNGISLQGNCETDSGYKWQSYKGVVWSRPMSCNLVGVVWSRPSRNKCCASTTILGCKDGNEMDTRCWQGIGKLAWFQVAILCGQVAKLQGCGLVVRNKVQSCGCGLVPPIKKRMFCRNHNHGGQRVLCSWPSGTAPTGKQTTRWRSVAPKTGGFTLVRGVSLGPCDLMGCITAILISRHYPARYRVLPRDGSLRTTKTSRES